jgi:phosphatidylinositol alpha 1,6-mannosyltransferase
MRVAIVTESFLPSTNGVTNSVLRILDTFKQRDFEALVIAPTRTGEKHNGYPVHQTVSFPLLQFPVAVPGPSIQRELDDFRPDVIHVAAPFMIGAQAIAWGSKNNIPVVAVYQTDLSGYIERYGLSFARPVVDRMMASIHEKADVNLAPTPEAAEYLTLIGVQNVGIWGRGVDLDLFNPAHKTSEEVTELRKKIAPNGERIIGFVGRLAAEKQVHRMSELLSLENTKFVIVGDGPERTRLEAQFAGHGVYFAGRQTALDLAYHYAALDMFVHFGTEETFGQTIQEAQASGLPVVAPNVGGPRFLIEHGVSGFLANPEGQGGYQRLVSKLLEDGKLQEKMAHEARKAVTNKSWETNNARLIEFYQQAIEQVATKAARIGLA